MQHRIRILFLSLLAALCLGLVACSDSDEPAVPVKEYVRYELQNDIMGKAWIFNDPRTEEVTWIITTNPDTENINASTISYKLFGDSIIHFVEKAEVGKDSINTLWLCNAATGEKLFRLQEPEDGGTAAVHPVYVTDSGREISYRFYDPQYQHFFYVRNLIKNTTVKLRYTNTLYDFHKANDINYVVENLPHGRSGAYIVPVLFGSNGLKLEVSAKGVTKTLSSQILKNGLNVATVSDADMRTEGDIIENFKYDTTLEAALRSYWTSSDDFSFLSQLYFDGQPLFCYYIEDFQDGDSFSRYRTYSTDIRVKLFDDGSRSIWSGSFMLFRILDYKENNYITIREGAYSWDRYVKDNVTLRYNPDKVKMIYVKNKSSYHITQETFDKLISDNKSFDISLFSYSDGPMLIDTTRFSGDLILTIKITANTNHSLINPNSVDFTYTLSITPDSPDVICIEITDDDIKDKLIIA